MHVVITGSSGLIGAALVERLRAGGHEVTRLVRRSPGAGEAEWDPRAGVLDPRALDGTDAVVHLAGAGIGDKRWTDAYKREILESRTLSTALLARSIVSADRPPKVLLSGSAIGYYGARGDETLTEDSAAGTGFLTEVCEAWEAAATPVVDAGVRLVHLRTGIVLSPRGGALKKQLPLFKLGLGGKMGDGTAWQSWISLDDELRAIEHLLHGPGSGPLHGPVNLTAPSPVTNAEFASTLAKVLGRPSFMRVPEFGPKLVLGSELADTLLFSGQRVLPAALERSGFTFEHPTLEGALRALLGRTAT